MAQMPETTISGIQEEFKKKLKHQGDVLFSTSLVSSVLKELKPDNKLNADVEVTSSSNTFKLTLTFLTSIPILEVVKNIDNPKVASVIVSNNGTPGRKLLQMTVNIFSADSSQTITNRPAVIIKDILFDESIVREGLVLPLADKENMLKAMKAITASAQGDSEIVWYTSIASRAILLDAVPVKPYDAFMFLYLKNTLPEIESITLFQENAKADQKQDHIEIVMKLAPPSKSQSVEHKRGDEPNDKKSLLRHAILTKVNESANLITKKKRHANQRPQRSWFSTLFQLAPDDDDADDGDDSS